MGIPRLMQQIETRRVHSGGLSLNATTRESLAPSLRVTLVPGDHHMPTSDLTWRPQALISTRIIEIWRAGMLFSG